LCHFNSNFKFFNYFINNIDSNLLNFNKYLFYNKQKIGKISENQADNISNNSKKSFMQKFKVLISKNKSFNNIPLQHETLLLRKFMFDSLSQVKFPNFSNLNKSEIDLLFSFLSEKPFIITSCDKNIGFAILSKELYVSLANEHLESNSMQYKKLDKNPLKHTCKKINDSLIDLNSKGHISNKLLLDLLINKSKLGKFKIMPKLHKPIFGIRPIIASINHPTSVLSSLIDLILQDFVTKTETYIKDSQNLIQNSINISVDSDTELYSLDFANLYTSINSEDAIHRISDFIRTNFKSDNITTSGFNTILKLVLYNNIFEFNKTYYIQTNGVAMGCKCGPTVANLYLYILEKHWLFLVRPLLYNRYIDDSAIVCKGKLNVEFYKEQFSPLELTFENNKEMNFLDLIIKVNYILNKLDFNLYIKKTQTFQYVPTSSNHPDYIFKNIPKSLFLRIRRICSNYNDFLYHSRNLIFNLINRGYDFNLLLKTFTLVSKIDRISLIQYKSKDPSSERYTLRINMSYDHNYLNLKEDFINNFNRVKDYYNWLSKFKISFSNTIMPNFKKILIDNFNFKKFNASFFTKRCNLNDCRVCHLILNISYLYLNKFIIPMANHCTCISKQVVYIIKCIKCNCFYIGETEGIASKRISQHINSILKFDYKEAFIFSKPVAEHFRLKNHVLNRDFRFCIFNKNLINKVRLSTESDLISIFKQFANIINIKKTSDKSDFKYISFLSFS
jgi:hypothetical protein